MSDSNTSTNTFVLLVIFGGLYYMKNITNSSENERKTNEEENNNIIPYVLALILVFSLKKEIEETITRDRIYTLVAITAASYLNTAGADIVQIFGSVFGSMIMLPAIQEYDKK